MTSPARKRRDRRAEDDLPILETLTLSAEVLVASELPAVSQDELAELADVSARTIADWGHRGLPLTRDGRNRPSYPMPEAAWWGQAWRLLSQQGDTPRQLSLGRAINLLLQHQAKDQPDAFLLVPLDPSHPCRRHQLERAARGLETERGMHDGR